MKRTIAFALIAVALAALLVFACESPEKKKATDDDEALPSGCGTLKTSAPDQASDCPTPDLVPGTGVTWADEVISSSSEWCEEPGKGSAQDATGAPDCLETTLRPKYGNQGCAWASREITDGAYIELGFPEQPYPPSRMMIYEVVGIDGIREALITFTDGTTSTYTHTPQSEKTCFNLVTFDFDLTPNRMVDTIRITLDQTPVEYYTEIDAVGLI